MVGSEFDLDLLWESPWFFAFCGLFDMRITSYQVSGKYQVRHVCSKLLLL